MTNPPLPPAFNVAQMANKTGSSELNTSSNSIDSCVSDRSVKNINTSKVTPSGNTNKTSKTVDPMRMAKQQVIAYLRFFSSLISLSIT